MIVDRVIAEMLSTETDGCYCTTWSHHLYRNYIKDQMIPHWMDLVIWGHEHEVVYVCLMLPFAAFEKRWLSLLPV